MNRPLVIGLLVLSSLPLSAQDSLADAARKARSDKASQPKSKVVIDDDSSTLKNRSPFPDLNVHGLDNSEDVAREIDGFRATHSPAEAEAASRQWYEDHDQHFMMLAKEQQLLSERHNQRQNEIQAYPDRNTDWRKYQQEQMLRQQSDDADKKRMAENMLVIGRIQQGLLRVRNYLQSKGARYDWFKVRNPNGVGSW